MLGTGSSIAAGIYYDNNANDILGDSNSVYHCKTSSLFSNLPVRDTFRYNTSYNSVGTGFYYTIGGGNNMVVQNNIFYSGDSTQVVLFSAYYNETPGIVYDYNYYLRPLKQTNLLKENVTTYSLPAWQAAFPIWDAHSSLMPSGVTSALPLFYYNPTKVDSVIALTGAYYDAMGVLYNNSVTVHPYQSVLLFKSISEVVTPKQIFNRSFKLNQK